MPQELKYTSLEKLPEVVEAGTSLEVGGFYTTRVMSRDEYLSKLNLQELTEKYLK